MIPYLDDPCTWRVAPGDPITQVCPNCGHNMVVHGGWHNTALEGCVICMMISVAIRLEERQSPVVQIKVTEDERDQLVKDMSLTKHRHEPVDHSGGRQKPSATVRSMMCLVCHGDLIPNADETAWIHKATPPPE